MMLRQNLLRQMAATALAMIVLTSGNTNIAYGQTMSSQASGAQKFDLSLTDIPVLEKQALSGDAESAVRLGQYYVNAAVNIKEARYWFAIAAENGSVSGMYNLAFYLAVSAEVNDKIRAKYWLEQVIKSNKQPEASLAEGMIKSMKP